ncbi:flavin monoamine oxidase family protein [Mycobacterium kiyosense]|uniref:flavin monoamine oxidase family protein n=2 Tax=Mycobacterium kiyosense TaxID=2871094 RepID=UPI001F3196C4|nr:FAD-dependent oxidoreductase [Mycobacterium kiyosense]BDB41279.1 monoamine oxidase [Mycobacterium kiyosense]GLB89503.1 monoamine oxidase [Mycobacterium kiyosense]GLC02404.1 monoamine oxidase [Mycobacterium kiyosense]GLC07661.1 monoamine oxidase [Mycobacterium kiyosense]GLC13101.1 monoamine oxidase [Mycobacterium kiyosense]
MTDYATVAVVGAGMSGLVAARDLHRQGIDVVVLEAADRVGGRMMGETSALGSRLDLGGQWIGHGHHRFAALAAELGTTKFDMRTPKSPAILDGGHAVSLLSPPVLMAFAALAGVEAMSRLPAPDRWDTTTVEDWLRRVPSSRARRLLELITVVSSTADPDRCSIRALISLIRYEGGLTKMLKTKGGAQESLLVEAAATLPERLAADLGERVYTGCGVTAVRQGADEVSLATSTGQVRAARAVITVPPPMARRIAFEPALPPERIALQRSTYMGSVFKAIAVYDTPFWRARTHAECLVLGDPGFAVFDSSPPDGPGHLCLLVAGPDARALDTDTDRRATLLGQLRAHLGPQVVQPASWHEKAWHSDSFVGGGYIALPDKGTRAGFLPFSSQPSGHIHWAGAETAAEHAGYIDGAIEAGARAAREVAESLQGAGAT